MRLILLGAPGSGKGTIAGEISKKFGISHVSTGDLFRKNIKGNTALGQEAQAYMEKGELVPDELTIRMLEDRFSEADIENGFLLDGFPRNIAQADALQELLQGRDEKLDVALNVFVPYDIIKERISGRRICSNCGAAFNIYFDKPKNEGVCDNCNSELTQRSDDNEETVVKRLQTYEEQTKPLIEYYENLGILKTVDNSGELEATLEKLWQEL